MSDWAPKRFWKDATVTPVEDRTGFEVLLDGRGVRTPLKRRLVLPTEPMAEAVAGEWAEQTDQINPNTMPVTRSANAAIDKVADQHPEVANMVADYGDSDLLCYRAEAPDALAHRQAEGWDPVLDWAREELGAVLRPVNGIMHRPQDPEALSRLRHEVHAFDPFRLTALHDLVAMSGSLIIGLAASRNAFPLDDLWRLSRIDEEWQIEQWGRDDEAEQNAEIKRRAFHHAHRFFALSETS
ncbi:ATPase [Brevirhabdus pacifica]|uniref:ATPase n=1 Tax=Brevirhabdus pacifica TaxID=1267768 RepID=A0A1U7DJX5_9RHOB|nr:ATP12 family protein [Brevirhabdus pacifica]APX90168.1 ATPase [Brevirhabdus pacifica]OWU78771.1 ATPase [Loktanella sp. 22II-4b]PJJ80594.1 chaperone required for assembly of F1-ATPase [Brevirhabdus pacifica]